MKKIFKVIFRTFYCLKKIKWSINLNDRNADYIVWSPNFFTLRFLHGDNLPKALGLYYSLLINNKKVTIYTKKDIGKFKNKRIFIIGTHMYNIYEFEDYTDIIRHIVSQLEKQDNTVFPKLEQINYWENKVFMHQKFDEVGIKTPQSYMINSLEELNCNEISFPFLIKEPHSCSAKGIYKINNGDDLIKLKKELKLSSNLIVQELLNIRKDLRVIIVGKEIVLHYWRINLAKEWKPTSTGHGSKVDFITFPDKWKNLIIQNLEKLNLDTGAFDIAWNNDDLNTEPYFLEVSPFYQPNPIPKFDLNKLNYGDWKNSFSIKNNYNKEVIDLIFKIQYKYIQEIIKKYE